MITAFFIWLLGTVVVLVFGLFPDLPSPEPLLGGTESGIGYVVSSAGALSFWVPFGAAGSALVVVAGVAVIAFGIKLARIVASFLTLGGGSAA